MDEKAIPKVESGFSHYSPTGEADAEANARAKKIFETITGGKESHRIERTELSEADDRKAKEEARAKVTVKKK